METSRSWNKNQKPDQRMESTCRIHRRKVFGRAGKAVAWRTGNGENSGDRATSWNWIGAGTGIPRTPTAQRRIYWRCLWMFRRPEIGGRIYDSHIGRSTWFHAAHRATLCHVRMDAKYGL